MWPMGQLPGTSANKSDTVVAEEVSMAACSKPKSSGALSLRPQGHRACAGSAHAKADGGGLSCL